VAEQGSHKPACDPEPLDEPSTYRGVFSISLAGDGWLGSRLGSSRAQSWAHCPSPSSSGDPLGGVRPSERAEPAPGSRPDRGNEKRKNLGGAAEPLGAAIQWRGNAVGQPPKKRWGRGLQAEPTEALSQRGSDLFRPRGTRAP